MFGPGEYAPDPTEGITDVKALPQPKIVVYSRTLTQEPCPQCGPRAYRHTQGQRRLHDLGDLDTGRPVDLLVTSSRHQSSERTGSMPETCAVGGTSVVSIASSSAT